MDNISSAEFIKKLYNKKTYFDKYGGSVIFTTLVLLIFFLIFSYLYIQLYIEPIKKNWQQNKCSPAIIPFAGIIMQGETDQSWIDFTSENFAKCTNTILANIVQYFISPLYNSSNIVNNIFKRIVGSLNIIRKLFAYIRTAFAEIVQHILSKISNIIIPIQQILIKLKDSLAKSVGALTGALYTTMAAYLSIKSFIGSFLKIVIAALIIAVGLIIAMWILPFTWPVAAASTLLFVAVSIPVAIIAGWMSHILNLSTQAVPGKPGRPSCFDENTIIKTNSKEIKIKNLKKGTILSDGSIVTSVFKTNRNTQKMYNLKNILVTETHKVFHDDKGWIYVKEHPDAILISDYDKEFVYCFNTDTKRIKMNGIRFLDWDELEPIDIIKLKNLNYLKNNSSLKDIHKFLDSGFIGSSLVEMNSGENLPIKKIKVNDILKNNNKVLGIVKIETKDISNIYKYKINNTILSASSNINVNDINLGIFSLLNYKNKTKIYKKPKTLYHLITDNGMMYINNIRFSDYDSAIENIIDMRNNVFSHM